MFERKNQDHDYFSPFNLLGQDYDNQIGIWRLKAYRYRALTFFFMITSLLLSIFFVTLTQQPREKVIAVQILHTGFSTGASILPSGSLSLLNQERIK
jgi:hypothetical protein